MSKAIILTGLATGVGLLSAGLLRRRALAGAPRPTGIIPIVTPYIDIETAEGVLAAMERLPHNRVTIVLHTLGGCVTACVIEAYTAFAGLCSGALLVHERVKAALPALKADTYAIGGHGVPRAEQVEVREGAYHFDLVAGGVILRGLRLGMAGRHNVENATAAAAMALRAGVAPEALRAALASFRGVERRFQTILGGPATVFIDDYAHHPAELDAAIRSARELHPTRSLTIVFQPHSSPARATSPTVSRGASPVRTGCIAWTSIRRVRSPSPAS